MGYKAKKFYVKLNKIAVRTFSHSHHVLLFGKHSSALDIEFNFDFALSTKLTLFSGRKREHIYVIITLNVGVAFVCFRLFKGFSTMLIQKDIHF
jgi:hypothetical protein